MLKVIDDGNSRVSIPLRLKTAMSLSSPSLRCLSVLRKCYGSSTTGSHRRLLTTQSTEEVISPYIIHKASSSRRANTGSRGGVTSETNVEQDVRPATLAIPTLAENPRWILPIPEKPKRQLVSRRSRFFLAGIIIGIGSWI